MSAHMWRITSILFLLVLACLSYGLAAESVTIERLQANPQSYNLKVVTLKGSAHQIQVLTSPPSKLPQLDFQCAMVHPPYTFVLSDETGFLQITVRARLPCVSKQSPAEPPDVSDNDTVEIDAQITVLPGNTVDALAINIKRLGN